MLPKDYYIYESIGDSMRRAPIYQGSTNDFISDVNHNRISDIMRDNFISCFGYVPSPGEYRSWQNSSNFIKNVVAKAELSDNQISLEYEVPYNNGRIDCLLFGKGNNGKKNVMLIELKQWNKVKPISGQEGNYEVETFVGGGPRIVPHPSQQTRGYHNYLLNFMQVFESELSLYSCAYCHNYLKTGSGLYEDRYQNLLDKYPLFSKKDFSKLGNLMKTKLSKGDGLNIFNKFMQSRITPSKKLLDNAVQVINNKEVFSLLNEQIVAKNLILSFIKESGRKSVIIVNGGPGTGKTLIALHVLAEIASEEKKVFFGCKSKSLRTALQNKVKSAKMLFSNLYRFTPFNFDENELDALIVDEAHRLEEKNYYRFMKKEKRSELPQVDQLIKSAKTCVFFIDDNQVVRSQEIGSTDLIEKSAQKLGASVHKVKLKSQFRCNGSDKYLEWVNSLLYNDTEPRVLRSKKFDCRIFSSPHELYSEIKRKNNEPKQTARLVAGFCWPWSNKLDENGNLVNDVKIGEFELPWETHFKISPPTGYARWYEWAYKPEGIKQVGCIYTAQGFEFDYIGVIIGEDLVYDEASDSLKGNISATEDPKLKRSKENFDKYVKNIYRVLLTRGMKGCYMYFTNKKTEEYFKKHMNVE